MKTTPTKPKIKPDHGCPATVNDAKARVRRLTPATRRRFFPLRRKHVLVPPDRRPRVLRATVCLYDTFTDHADDAWRLFGAAAIGKFVSAQSLITYAKKTNAQVVQHWDDTVDIIVTRKPTFSKKQPWA